MGTPGLQSRHSYRPKLRQEILNHGRGLERLEIEYKKSLEDAQASYQRQIVAAWEGSCKKLMAAMGSTPVQKSPKSLPDVSTINSPKGSQPSASIESVGHRRSTEEDFDTGDESGMVSTKYIVMTDRMVLRMTQQA